jgi:hypothetical protein
LNDIKVGDLVVVSDEGLESNYEGVGHVSKISPGDNDTTWYTVIADAWESWDFPAHRVRRAEDTPPPVGEHNTADSFHFFEALLDSAEEAHPSSKMFYNELISCGLLHAQKQRDYGKPGDPFANVRSTVEWGIPAWVGAMVRLNDKVKRLQALARTGGLANESAVDSFRDIAVYALIALVLYSQEAEEA